MISASRLQKVRAGAFERETEGEPFGFGRECRADQSERAIRQTRERVQQVAFRQCWSAEQNCQYAPPTR